MEYYGAQYKIKYIAPTASAEFLVEGTTIHKAFSIKVRKHHKTA